MNHRKASKSSIVFLILSGILLAGSGGLVLLFKRNPSLFFPAYRSASKIMMRELSKVTGLVPVSLWDVGAAVLAALLIITLILTLCRRKSFLKWLSIWIFTLSFLAAFAVSGWLLNHYAPKLSADLGLEVRKYSEEELFEATKYYMDRASEYALLQERDENDALVRQDFFALARQAGKSYETISERFMVFSGGSDAPVKKLTLSGRFYLERGICGIFMPLSGESSVPEMDAVTDLPFTMAHECAHRLGIASEEECNFAAFLACESSGDPYFLYSGYYSAYIYCHNKLLGADKRWNEALMESAAGRGYELLFSDMRASSEWYRSFEKEKARQTMDKVNDTYLKSFSQEEGVKSYGEVVNDLIAWYLQEHSEKQ